MASGAAVLQKVKFSDVFQTRLDGTIAPKKTIEVNGVRIPPGVFFRPDSVFRNIDLTTLLSGDLAVDIDADDVYRIVGRY